MRNFYFIYSVFILLSSTVTAQDNASILFSHTLHRSLKSYLKKSDLAYRNGDIERAAFLFDSLVQHQLTGTVFDDFSLKHFHKKQLKLSTVKKPIFLITYASWCVPGKGEIPALNKLARQYGKDIQFIVLYWDRKTAIKKLAKKFDRNIEVCFAHETYNTDAYLISTLKHPFGLPTCFFLDKDMTVVSIRRTITKPDHTITYDKAVENNYGVFKEKLNCLLAYTPTDLQQHLAGH